MKMTLVVGMMMVMKENPVKSSLSPSRGFIKLKENFGLDDSTAATAFLNIKSFSSETFIRSFQLKLLADIT